MQNKLPSLEKQLKENIKYYSLEQFFDREELQTYLEQLAKLRQADILLTQRHGEVFLEVGLSAVKTEISAKDRKLSVMNRTVGHLYVLEDGKEEEEVDEFWGSVLKQLEFMGTAIYKQMELAVYAEELEDKLETGVHPVEREEKKDPLTGVYNRTYFRNRLKILDRSEAVPVMIICGNINDWKYVHDNYGEEESNRLIKVIANILTMKAKPEYVIGRYSGDVFYIIIPFALESEAKEYCEEVQKSCLEYKDEILAPSIAFGIVEKTNIEENLEGLFSDAEYEMFSLKIHMKNQTGYKERLEKGRKMV